MIGDDSFGVVSLDRMYTASCTSVTVLQKDCYNLLKSQYWIKNFFSIPTISLKGENGLSEAELNILHAEAVLAGNAGEDNMWFNSIDAG